MKIEVRDNLIGSTIKICDYPFDYQYFGDDELNPDLKIFIRQDVLMEVDEYLSSDTNNELGGVLAGDVCVNEDGKKFIVIDGKIIAKHTNSSLSRLTFTHDTWEYINEILEKDFPDKKILGWFHSHPGHTVFLSSFDIFIQENFFNMDYMVAYVFDPTIKDRGFFNWNEKKIVKSHGFYLYDIKKKQQLNELFNKVNKAADESEVLKGNPPEEINVKPKIDFKNIIIIGLLIVSFLLTGLMIYNFFELKKTVLLKDDFNSEVSELKNESRLLNEKLDKLMTNPVTNTSADELNSNVNDSSKTLTQYTVKEGDNVDKIAFMFYKNKSAGSLIMQQNNLKSKWDIKAGQVLEIPEISE